MLWFRDLFLRCLGRRGDPADLTSFCAIPPFEANIQSVSISNQVATAYLIWFCGQTTVIKYVNGNKATVENHTTETKIDSQKSDQSTLTGNTSTETPDFQSCGYDKGTEKDTDAEIFNAIIPCPPFTTLTGDLMVELLHFTSAGKVFSNQFIYLGQCKIKWVEPRIPNFDTDEIEVVFCHRDGDIWVYIPYSYVKSRGDFKEIIQSASRD